MGTGGGGAQPGLGERLLVRAHSILETRAQACLGLWAQLCDRRERSIVFMREIVKHLRVASAVGRLGQRLVDPAPGELEAQLCDLLGAARELET